MSDSQQAALGGNQAGQPAPASDGSVVPPSAQPEVVTRAEAERMAQEAEERAFRRSQALVDANATRIEKQVQGTFTSLSQAAEALKSVGHEIPPDVLVRAQNATLVGAFAKPAESAAQPPASGQASPGQGERPAETPDPITALALRMQQKSGIMLDEKDPEVVGNAKLTSSDPDEFIQGIREGIEAKKARLAAAATAGGNPPLQPNATQAGQLTPEQQEQQRLARMTSVGAGAGGSAGSGLQGLSTQQLLEQAFPPVVGE